MLDGPRGASAHDLGEVTVHATSAEGAEAAPAEMEIDGAIAFTKEVQWRIPFMTQAATMRELAELWDPDLPAHKNEEYIARSRELEKDLEAALLAQLAAHDRDVA